MSEKLPFREDLREIFERSDVSAGLKALLDQRRARVQRGEARLLDWDAIKGSIARV